MNTVNIMYIHGLNSNGDTGRKLEKYIKDHTFPSKYNINFFHPQIPKEANKAIDFVNQFVDANDINMVIGTSLGGFLTLGIEGVYRLVVNPALHPSETLPKLGEPTIAKAYKKYEDKLIDGIDLEKRLTTIAYFADKDEVVNNYDEYNSLFGNSKRFSGYHRMTDNDLKRIIIPEIEIYISYLHTNLLALNSLAI